MISLRRILVAVALLPAALLVATGTPAHAAGVTAAFTKTSDWGTAYQGQYTITNGTAAAVKKWTLEFDLPSGQKMGSFWDTVITTSGQHQTAVDHGYNDTINPGASVSFGFLVNYSGAFSPPTNCTINGAPCTGAADTQPPSAPGNPRASGATPTSVTLAWDASTDNTAVSGYDVFNGSTRATSVTGTTATVTGLTPSTAYTFTVKAKDAAGNVSPASAAVTVTTPPAGGDTVPPSAPGNLRSTATTSNSVTLTWDAATDNVGVIGYDVLNGTAVATSVSATTATVTGLQPSTSYTFAVKARDAAGNASSASNAVKATTQAGPVTGCRPDGLYQTPGVTPPYCQVYDSAGREKMASPRRVIGYFTGWRHGKNGQPAYLVNNVPWSKLTHINYAFAHVDGQNKVSVGGANANNPAIGMEWPGVAGAEMDPAYSYKGHFNLLSKFKKQYPNVKTLVSIGGWAETGGYFDDSGKRVASGGFFTMTESQSAINTFADSVVAFIRQYGFNGADIDYEYATSMTYAGNPDDFKFSNPRRASLMRGYVALMKTLREKLDAASAADNKYYMLTAAVSASAWILRGADVYQVTQYLDYANLMTYDLHGAWNHFVGPNAALYDDGRDSELVHWQVYSTYGMGYLNSDWAYHYFRGAMQAGRINLGVGFYTRGFQGVSGGTNGLWGTAALPDQTKCPPGTGSSVGSSVPCGNGAIGIDNLWHDDDLAGKEIPSGTNPMWHAKNLQDGRQGDYLTAYGLDPVNDPTDRVTGTYARNYNTTLVTPWLWNASKKVFLSTEDDQSIATKAQYVVDKGLGGIMFWELAGDYAWDAARNGGQGEYFMGSTLTTAIATKFASASPYGATKANRTMPTNTLNVKVELTGFAVGDANYPITPKMRITNSSTTTIPGGAKLEFDYGTSAPATMGQQSGWAMTVTPGHSGGNVGGLRGDFQHVTITVPSYLSIAPGATAEIALTYQLPIASPSNYTLAFGGSTYALSTDNPR